MSQDEVNKAAERVLNLIQRGYSPRQHFELDDVRAVCKAYLVERDPTLAEQADDGWLQEIGFKWSLDGTCLEIGKSLQVIASVNTNSRSDDYGLCKSIALYWHYENSTPKVTLHYATDDNPTRGQVLQLLRCLGVETKEYYRG